MDAFAYTEVRKLGRRQVHLLTEAQERDSQ